MAVTLPNPTLTGTIVATELDANFSTLASKFGSITNADISAGAALDTTKFAAYYQETFVTLTISASDLAAGWPAASVTTPLQTVPIPYITTSDEAWVVTDIGWLCQDTGAGTGQFGLYWGAYSTLGTWENVGAAISTVTMANANAGNDANDGRVSGLTYSLAVPSPIEQRSIALVSAVVDATALTTAYSMLNVTLRLRRKLQAS